MSDATLPDDAASAGEPRGQAMRGDLTQGPVARTLLMFALPTLGSNVLQSLNGSISAIYVGKFLGENAFAAAGISNMVMFLIFSTVFGLSMAATIMIGQAMGRRDVGEVRRTIGATNGCPFLSLEFVSGGSLADKLTHSAGTNCLQARRNFADLIEQ